MPTSNSQHSARFQNTIRVLSMVEDSLKDLVVQ
jgi:hypothetical protein